MGDRMEPTRARPVPFCFHSFLPEPATSRRTLVLCVPARSPAWKCRTASYSSASFTSAPKTASASSSSPTFSLFKSTTSTVGIGLPLGPPHDHVAAVGSGHRALHHQHVVLGVHFHHLQVAHGDPRIAHVAGHAHPRHHARGVTGSADGTGSAMEHRPVGAFAAAEVMALHQAGEAAALADADHVHLVLRLELVHQHLVAELEIVVAGPQLELAQELAAFRASLFEMTRGGFVDPLRLDELHQAELHGVIPVRGGRLALHHRARTRLEQGDRHRLSVGPEHLRHSDFFTENSWTHMLKESEVRSQESESLQASSFAPYSFRRQTDRRPASCLLTSDSCLLTSFYFPNALISTSTPAGRSSFISASTVCWVGSRMSKSRLCVRISNCSRDFLSTCGDRRTVVMLREVGSGIGPATEAPVRLAVSTISDVDWSSTR